MDINVIAAAMLDGQRFSTLDEDKRYYGLLAIIGRLYSLKGMGDKSASYENGIATPTPEVLLAVDELTKEIAQNYPYITMSEIKFALESGVKSNLDDQPNILNIANYCRWLALYYKSASRLEAIQLIENRKRITPPSNCLGYGEVESRNDKAMRTLYEQFKEEVVEKGCISKKHLDINCSAVYDWCRKAGRILPPSPDKIESALTLARNTESRKELSEWKTVERAKRIILEEYLRAN